MVHRVLRPRFQLGSGYGLCLGMTMMDLGYMYKERMVQSIVMGRPKSLLLKNHIPLVLRFR
jgi:hypothetical protein